MRYNGSMTLKILYEDNHLLALDKPTGILTQPNGTDRESLEERAKKWLKEKYQKKGNVYLHAVHRLDKPVAGVVLFAKTQKGLSRMNLLMREGKIKKFYRAWIEGTLASDGTLVSKLVHGNKKAMVSEEGKPSKLHYRVLKHERNMTLVEVELMTGRYHQIRAQFAEIGFPIVGDAKYGAKPVGEGILLCHVTMEFAHPVTGEKIEIRAAADQFL